MMEINLGRKIKALRKQKNISQEVLAQALGVTFQAVSKWETGVALPDVAMIPVIAGFFEVSTDELFDFNLIEQERKVMKICEDAAAYRFSNPQKSEAMLRDGLKQFPGNDVILNNLLYTLQSPERNEEIITICKSILEVTRDDEVKYDVLRILAKTYHQMGQQALVKQTLQQIPELYFSKSELDAKYLQGEEALRAAALQAGISQDTLLEMIARMSQLYREMGDDKMAADYADLTHRVFALFEGRTDTFGNSTELHKKWLREQVWARLED